MTLTRTEQICLLHKAGLKAQEISERVGMTRQGVYKALRRGGVLPPYEGNPPPRRSYKPRRDWIPQADLPPRLDRDPCVLCGVRGDIGCRHVEAA
jgi:IS30 family transposase